MISDARLNKWRDALTKYRSSIDLATLIWFWVCLQENNPDEAIVNDESVWKDVYDLIMEDAEDLIFERLVRPQIKTSVARLGGAFGRLTDEPSRQAETKKTTWHEEWFSGYRDTFSLLVTYADDVDYQGVDDDINRLPIDEYELPANYQHSVLSDPKLTLRFISLDDLVERLHKKGRRFPGELVLDRVDRTSNTGSRLSLNVQRGSEDIRWGFKFTLDDPFWMLQMAELCQRYFLMDKYGYFVLMNQSGKAAKDLMRQHITPLIQHGERELYEHIWRLLWPVTGLVKRSQGGREIRHSLCEVIDTVWGDEASSLDYWKANNRDVRKIELMDKGYSAKEAETVIAMITPTQFKNSSKPSAASIARYRKVLLEMELSWLTARFS